MARSSTIHLPESTVKKKWDIGGINSRTPRPNAPGNSKRFSKPCTTASQFEIRYPYNSLHLLDAVSHMYLHNH